MQRRDDGGLGNQLVGDKITVNDKSIQVTKLIGEGKLPYFITSLKLEYSNCQHFPI